MSKASSLPGMGASVNINGKGVTFRVWAPYADQVYVAGSFTNPPWNEGKIRLARDDEKSGFWSVFVLEAKVQDQYKFVISSKDQPDVWKLDPYCRQTTGHINIRHGLPCENTCVIINPNLFKWDEKKFTMSAWNDLIIYELHLGTFTNNSQSTRRFLDAISKLDYLVELGINAIEVMPCTEFTTNTSMGYNPSLLFAIEDHYGEERNVQRFVNEANRRGIAVIFDVVYNHLGPDDLSDCFWRFDGWHNNEYGGIYFYQDERAVTAFGATRPDYGRPEVRQILHDNAMMWFHEYHADGLRLDSTINIRRSQQGDLPDGWSLMQWINKDKKSNRITIAEDLQDNEWLTKKIDEGGAGFSAQWDAGFYNVIRDAVIPAEDSSRSMFAINDILNKRYNNDAFQRVIYTESHDEVTEQFGVKLGRMPEKIWFNNPNSWPSRKRSTLAAAILFTTPGIPMIFQGQEFLECGTWTDNADTNPNAMLDWSKLEKNKGIFQLYHDLIKYRRNQEKNTRGLMGQHIRVFHINNEKKIIAYQRWMEGGKGDDVIIVANFSSESFDSYTIGFPNSGTWELRFNSDWKQYSDDFTDVGYTTMADEGEYDGLQCHGNVGLGPYIGISQLSCCPNGCCGFCKPPIQQQKQVETVIDLKNAVTATEIPYGFVKFYPGIRTMENTYTCPMLSIHLYRHQEYRADTAQDNRTAFFDGRNRQHIHQDEQQANKSEEGKGEEEVIMVPSEDILKINYKTEFRKGINADIRSHIVPTYELSENCCDRCCVPFVNCCRKTRDCCCCVSHQQTRIAPHVENTILRTDIYSNTFYREENVPLSETQASCCTRLVNRFRCWCCRRNILMKLTKKISTKAERHAERVITMTIEYSKYSHSDTPSNARLLTGQQQADYYFSKFQPHTELKFYLINSKEFDPRNFELKSQQAEILCRTVMQLKGMKDRYPSEHELNDILDQSHQRTFGQIFNEQVLQLTSDPNVGRIENTEIRPIPLSIELTTVQQHQNLTTTWDH
ncbi:hypothetical protein I4U23_015644 [Adineta vaga]|nr:hypothetical protein I4U23_015644 [Adineta vaga]